MFTFKLILTIIILILLLIVITVRPKHSEFSLFELERRAESGDSYAKKAWIREKLLDDIISLQRLIIVILWVLMTVMMITTFGWLIGLLLLALIVFGHGAVTRLSFFKIWSQKLYKRSEDVVIKLIQKYPAVMRILSSAPNSPASNQKLGSRQELQYLVNNSDDLFSAASKALLDGGLFFDDKKVRDFMTPRESITYLKKSEMLGPLVLDELHKSGHSQLPVIDKDIDHVVGVLDLSDLMNLKAKQSVTADKAMASPAYCIAADQTLRQALDFFLTTHQRLILVVSKSKRIIGLLTLNDVMQALLGDDMTGKSTDDTETPVVTPIKNE